MNDPTFPSPVRGIDNSASTSPVTTTNTAGGTPQLSPSVVVIIVLITVVFFLSGFLHLLARCFARPGGSSPGNNNQPRRINSSASLNSYQGQLQQLFHLHDSGVEQAFIDALPVFLYRAVRGLKDGADCAVCLNEFSGDDRLRLLPKCSHAFHIECIDTWLLSHSTCPLCRCSLVPDHLQCGPGSSVGMRVESFGASSIASTTVESLATVSEHTLPNQQHEEQEDTPAEQRVQQLIPVKLGRFNSNPEFNPGSRRSYSMGSYEYVLDSSAAGEQVVAVALISPTPMHKKWVPRGTPGHRAALSESVPGKEYPSGGSPWVTIDIDPRPMLEQQQGGVSRGSFLNWVPWKRRSSTTSEKSFDSERGKSFSFRLGGGEFQEQHHQQHDSGAVWWWKNRGSISMRSEANDQRLAQMVGASGAPAPGTHGVGSGAAAAGGASWDQASICSTNAEMKSTGSGASSMTTVSIARRTLQWLMGRDKHHHRNSGEDVAVY